MHGIRCNICMYMWHEYRENGNGFKGSIRPGAPVLTKSSSTRGRTTRLVNRTVPTSSNVPREDRWPKSQSSSQSSSFAGSFSTSLLGGWRVWKDRSCQSLFLKFWVCFWVSSWKPLDVLHSLLLSRSGSSSETYLSSISHLAEGEQYFTQILHGCSQLQRVQPHPVCQVL